MPKIIGVDCDEVLCETIKEVLKMPLLADKGITKQDITSYELYRIPKLCIDFQTSMNIFSTLFTSDQFRNIQPVPGALEKLQQWKTEGHTLIVLTGRSEAVQERTKQWVYQHFPHLFDDFLFSNHNVANEVPKSELCKQAGIELVIEDNLDFVAELSQHGIPCFLLDEPWNAAFTSQNYPGVLKISSWDEIALSSLFLTS